MPLKYIFCHKHLAILGTSDDIGSFGDIWEQKKKFALKNENA